MYNIFSPPSIDRIPDCRHIQQTMPHWIILPVHAKEIS